MANRKFPGVRRVKNRFQARIKDGAKRRSLGVFDTEDEARAAYLAAKAAAKERNPSWSTRELTFDRLKQVVSFNPETGEFTRINRAGVKGGAIGGGINRANGYRYIRIDGKRYMAHRVAWMYMTGSMPDGYLDHRDGNRANNSFKNLRLATYADNAQNRPTQSNNTTGLRGVCWHKPTGRFTARITKDGVQHFLGYFRDPQDAHRAYLQAKERLHSFQPSPRDL